MLVVLVAALAVAQPVDPSASCYEASEDPAAHISVVVNDRPAVGPTSRLEAIFGAVAGADPTGQVQVSANAAGEASIQAAMQCFLSHDTVTLGMIRMHQVAPDLAVRPSGILAMKNGNEPPFVLNEVTMEGLGRGARPIFVFSGTLGPDSCLSVALNAERALARGDWFFTGTSFDAAPGQTCTGVNCSMCGFRETGWGCSACNDADVIGKPAGCNHAASSSAGFVPPAQYLVMTEF